MQSLPVRDDYAFLIGKVLLEVSLGEARTELRFEQDICIDIAGAVEHRVHADTLGRAPPHGEALPNLLHLIGMTVCQVGVERDYLLLAFDDGHEVRLFKGSGEDDDRAAGP